MTGTLKALAPWPGLAEQMQERYVGKLEELRDAGVRTKLQVRLFLLMRKKRDPNRAETERKSRQSLTSGVRWYSARCTT